MTALDIIKLWFETIDSNLLDNDIEWLVPGYPVPQESYRGRSAVFDDFFPALTAQFAEWSAQPDEMIEAADGENVTVRGRYVGKTQGGEPVTIPFIHIWTVRDGKIVRAITSANTAIFADVLN